MTELDRLRRENAALLAELAELRHRLAGAGAAAERADARERTSEAARARTAAEHEGALAAGRAELAASEAEGDRLRDDNAALEESRAAHAASEERLRLIIESATDYAILTTDARGIVTSWSAGAEAVFGYAPGEIVGRPGALLFTPEDRAKGEAEAELETARRDGVAPDERWHLRKDGGRVFLRGVVRPLHGAIPGFLKVARDETGRRRADEERRRLAAIVEQSHDFIGVAAPGGQALYVNPAGRQLVGLPDPGAVRATNVADYFMPEDRRTVAEIALPAAARDGDWEGELRFRSFATDAAIPVLCIIFPVRDADGAVAGYATVTRDLTATRRAEAALRESEERFRALVNASSDAVYRMSPDWSEMRHLVGREFIADTEDPSRTWLEKYIHPDDQPRVMEAINKAIRTRSAFELEHRVIRADGTLGWTFSRAVPLADAKGEITEWFGAASDITERKRAEEALRRSQTEAERQRRLYEAILTNTPDLGYVFDLNHRFIYANEVLLTMWGRSWGEAIGKTCLELGYPDWHAAMHDREIEQVIATRQPIRGEVPFTGTFGRRIYDYIFVPVLGADGQVEAVAGTTRDVTDHKRAEESLRALNEELEAEVRKRTRERDRIWQVSQDMLGVADAGGVWLSVNPAWTRILGWPAEEIVGKTSEWLEHPDDREKTRAEIARLAAGQTTLAFENRFRTREGDDRVLSWTAVPADGLLYCVARDITAQKEQQAALAQAEEQLRQAQKMEAVGQLTGGLAHDFNNLLQGIAGSLELIQTRARQGRIADLERYVIAAQGAAGRAAALTHRLLAFSRRQTLDPRPVAVNRLVAGMEELIRRTMGPAIAVEVVAAGGLWTVLCDPNQLENALLNLCINARDAMPDGGRLTIETANAWLDDRGAQERDLAPGQYVALCVSDTGAGMAPEVAARAFEPFYTTKPLGQGTGLGLSMVYGFVRQSGGQVRLYSEPGQGTTVKLYLPRHHGGEAEGDAAEDGGLAGAARAAGPGAMVLVVDDEPTVRMLVVDVLAELGHAAIEAADGASGLRVLQSGARVDLLVTDVGLPGGMNGRQLADAARVKRPGLKVLFITGYAENAAVGNGHLEPGMHVLTKPFAMEALAAKIKAMIEN